MLDAQPVIIAGSRWYTPEEADLHVAAAMHLALKRGILPGVILSGKAKGIDAAGERWAAVRGITVEPYPAHWDDYGPSAGPRRNAQMIERVLLSDPVGALVAIPCERSKGTRDIINRACELALPIVVYEPWRQRPITKIPMPI